jgi:hypothetical protein
MFYKAKTNCIYFLLLLAFFAGMNVNAQTVADTTGPAPQQVTPPTNPANNPTATKPAASPRIVVTDVYNANHPDPKDPKHFQAGIGDIIVVKVTGLQALLDEATCKDTSIPRCAEQEVRLFINGIMISNIEPISGAPREDEGILQYRLDRNTDNDEEWIDLLGSPQMGREFFMRDVSVSVGLENGYAEDTIVENFKLVRIREGWFWVCFLGVIAYLAIFIYLIRKSNMLKDRWIDVSAVGLSTNITGSSYSLARFQMAFWFTLVIAAFLFIWLITGAYDIITTSVLALIGISAGTSLSAAVIDNSKGSQVLQDTVALQQEQTELQHNINSLNTQITTATATPGTTPDTTPQIQQTLDAKKARLAQIQPQLTRNMETLKTQKSRGFFNDILSDANGISFHRLQMFVWTIVLGILFIYSVWNRLSMPDFSATLLALQGITAGTYLGFKFPERQS